MLSGKDDPGDPEENSPAPDWLTDSAWKQICCLDKLTSFKGIVVLYVFSYVTVMLCKYNFIHFLEIACKLFW